MNSTPDGSAAKPAAPTDYRSLAGDGYGHLRRHQPRSITDALIDLLTPLLIFVMAEVVVFFLCDVRFIYDETMDGVLRFAAFFFVLGIVAVNRLAARDHSEESVLYIVAFGGVTVLFTMAFTSAYGGGSLAGPYLDHPVKASIFNLVLVGFLWWMVNRLVHEACVDENSSAGDVGIMTGAARTWLGRMKQVPESVRASQEALKDRKERYIADADPIDAVDPSQWKKPEPVEAEAPEEPTKRLSKKHPGMSVFYFSVPVLLAFVLGQRVVLHSESKTVAAHIYLVTYVGCALSLLMLTSLGGLREYFRKRRIYLPGGLGPFWIGLGFVMVLMVLFGAAAVPGPATPGIAHVEEHEYDPWSRDRSFQLKEADADVASLARQSLVVRRVGQGVLVILGAFAAYGLLRATALALASMARRRDLVPGWLARIFDRIERLLTRLTSVPGFGGGRKLPRVSRKVSKAARLRNPMLVTGGQADGAHARDLIEACYDALCALADDLGVPRAKSQTPYEFIDAFPRELSSLRAEARELTELYVRSSYAPFPLDERVEDRLRRFWLVYEKARARVVR